ncbi:hypothetical protein DY000_02052487 [Brassica cretica]|uniref:Uncharacterized protein n=1 Tax=Brassica cretica TaxID=69181 RepID=A0ABQ7AFS5_BRACR|nr:hypothetical protein DY000_02052487 [Brassica cretica]
MLESVFVVEARLILDSSEQVTDTSQTAITTTTTRDLTYILKRKHKKDAKEINKMLAPGKELVQCKTEHVLHGSFVSDLEKWQRKSLSLLVSPPPPIANSTSRTDRFRALGSVPSKGQSFLHLYPNTFLACRAMCLEYFVWGLIVLSELIIRLAWWQSFVVRSVVDGNSSETPASLSYAAEVSKPFVENTTKPYSGVDESATGKEAITESVEEHVASTQPKRAAKIHDFCFGIPYGGLVMSGGLLGFAFSRNLTSLSTGVKQVIFIYWRFPEFAVLSAVVFWKNFTAYSMVRTSFAVYKSLMFLCLLALCLLASCNLMFMSMFIGFM